MWAIHLYYILTLPLTSSLFWVSDVEYRREQQLFYLLVLTRIQIKTSVFDTILSCMHQPIQLKNLSWWKEVDNSLILYSNTIKTITSYPLLKFNGQYYLDHPSPSLHLHDPTAHSFPLPHVPATPPPSLAPPLTTPPLSLPRIIALAWGYTVVCVYRGERICGGEAMRN
jgi:hypothetical protein